MTYVVTDACIRCKYMDCVEVCPVDCFYEGENMLVINPNECIDCGVCEPECPAEAILPDTAAEAEHAETRVELVRQPAGQCDCVEARVGPVHRQSRRQGRLGVHAEKGALITTVGNAHARPDREDVKVAVARDVIGAQGAA